MNNLNYYLQQARAGGYALGHFNFATADVLRGIVEATRDAGAPAVMVGTSEGEANFFGLKEAVALVKVIREEYNFPVFLNADHHKSFESCKEAVDCGYDSVLIDASKRPYEENIKLTKEVVDYAKRVNPEILVEGELGYLVTESSKIYKEKIDIPPESLTKPEQAEEFVKKTGVDLFAPAIGNLHGIAANEPSIRLDLLTEIKRAVPDKFLVLHGASGLSDDDVRAAIKAGVTNVHFNTELRVAYTEGIHKTLHDKPGETTPYKYLAPAVEEVKKVVAQKIKLFMGK